MGLFARRKALKWTHELGEWARVAKDNRAATDDDREYARGVSFYVRSLDSHDADPEERSTQWTVQVLDGMQDANFLVNDVVRKGAPTSTDFRAALHSAHIRRLAEERRIHEDTVNSDDADIIESMRRDLDSSVLREPPEGAPIGDDHAPQPRIDQDPFF